MTGSTLSSDTNLEDRPLPEARDASRKRPARSVGSDDGSDFELGEAQGWLGRVAGFLALGLALFHVWTGYSGGLPAFEQRSVHLGVALPVLLLGVMAQKRKRAAARYVAWITGAASIATVVSFFHYIYANDDRVIREFRTFDTVFLLWAGAVCVIGLELARRMIGIVLPALVVLLGAAVVLPAYADVPWGDWVAHVKVRDFFNSLGYKNYGVLGSITGVSAGIVGSFLVFGGLLSASGGAQAFLNLARFLVGRYRGGPGKVSVITSAFFGTVSGSAIANVVVDGVFNIPLMKRSGFRPSFAAAVEATTSSGGQLVPPVMGASAFIMAELLGIPYSSVILAAIVPVLLFYIGVFVAIHIEAMKQGLPGIPKDQIPTARELVGREFLGSFLIPIGLMLFTLYYWDRSLLYASFMATAAVTIYILVFVQEPFAKRVLRVLAGLRRGGGDVARIVAIVVAAQLLIGVLSMSGAASRVANELAGADIPVGLSLVFLAAVVVILGMGVPTAAAYVLAASIATPIFFSIGIEPIAGHMFILYLTVYANITPPVMPATYAAVAIARADMFKAGIEGTKLLLPVLLVPFAVALEPHMLLEHGTVGGVAWGFGRMVVGMTLLAAGLACWLLRPLRRWEGALLSVGAALLAWPGIETTAIGAALCLPVLVPLLLGQRRERGEVRVSGAGVRTVTDRGSHLDVRGPDWDELVGKVHASFAGTNLPGMSYHVGAGSALVVACGLNRMSLAALVAARDRAAPTVLVPSSGADVHAHGAGLALMPPTRGAGTTGDGSLASLTPIEFEMAARGRQPVDRVRCEGVQQVGVLSADGAASRAWTYDRPSWDAAVRATARAFRLLPADRVLIWGDDIYRDHVAFLLAFATLSTGGLVVTEETGHPFDPAAWVRAVAEGEVSTALLSNERLREVVDHLQAKGGTGIAVSLGAVIHGGNTLTDESLVQDAIEVFGPILVQYYVPGDSLSGTVVSSEEWLERERSIGRPITDDTDITIAAADGTPLPPERDGSLVIGQVDTGLRARRDREGYLHLVDAVTTAPSRA